MDKVIVITGVSGGIGKGIARLFLESGWHVVGTYLNNKASTNDLYSLSEKVEGNFFALRVDVSKSEDVRSLFSFIETQRGRIDVLVNNAGVILKRTSFLSLTEEIWDRTLEVNTKSVFLCSQAALRLMVPRKEGKIINISSISGRTGGIPGESLHYGASKGAMNTLTKGLAMEFAKDNIQINAIAPGVIDTPIHDKYREEYKKRLVNIPLKRAGSVEEIAQAVSYLASEHSNFMTGEILTIAGGR